MNSEMLEKSIKIISTTMAIFGLFFGVYQYKKNSEMDFRKSIYGEKLRVYNDVMKIGSEIINTELDSIETPTFTRLYKDYRNLHFGNLRLIADSAVNHNSNVFLSKLEKYRRPGSRIVQEDMQTLLVSLSEACKKSLESTWSEDVDRILKSH